MFIFVVLFYVINLVSIFALMDQRRTGGQDCQIKM